MKIDTNELFSDMVSLFSNKIPHESDFLAFRNIAIQRPVLLDVGANSGQSAISFSMMVEDCQVHSLEPNHIYTDLLERIAREVLPNKLSVHMLGAGEEFSTLELLIPIVDGNYYLQGATVDRAQFDKPWVKQRFEGYGADFRLESLLIQLVPIDSLNLTPDVIKIDSEGYELSALLGAKNTIERSYPIFLIENNDWNRVTDFLIQYGYSCFEYSPQSNILKPLTDPVTNSFYLKPEHDNLFQCKVIR